MYYSVGFYSDQGDIEEDEIQCVSPQGIQDSQKFSPIPTLITFQPHPFPPTPI